MRLTVWMHFRENSCFENQIVVRKFETLNALVWLIVKSLSHVALLSSLLHTLLKYSLFSSEISSSDILKVLDSRVRPALRQENPWTHQTWANTNEGIQQRRIILSKVSEVVSLGFRGVGVLKGWWEVTLWGGFWGGPEDPFTCHLFSCRIQHASSLTSPYHSGQSNPTPPTHPPISVQWMLLGPRFSVFSSLATLIITHRILSKCPGLPLTYWVRFMGKEAQIGKCVKYCLTVICSLSCAYITCDLSYSLWGLQVSCMCWLYNDHSRHIFSSQPRIHISAFRHLLLWF